MIQDYQKFISNKQHLVGNFGFKPTFIPDVLFDFQKSIVEWSIEKGRSAVFADCGLGKTLMQLVWAQNVVEKENGNVLILTPLAVARQTKLEGDKFGIECEVFSGKPHKITLCNYEKLHLINESDYVGIACDESSILKNYNGATKHKITMMMRKMKYRSLWTATAAPNDYIELGTSSEALGHLGHMDMLNRFFKNDQNNSATKRMYGKQQKWRFKGHSEDFFWRWVSSWARAIRMPSDIGFDDGVFKLPGKIETQYIVNASRPREGCLFAVPAVGLREEREERRCTIEERCEMVANLVNTGKSALVWCDLNDEGDLLEKLIPDSLQVKGSQTEDLKEERLIGFAKGDFRVMITKPKIGAWGLNYQHCSHMTFFPSHSYEQYYQGVRRCWRFGQKNDVKIDIVSTEGERNVLYNLQEKSKQADRMFQSLVKFMNDSVEIQKKIKTYEPIKLPNFLKGA